MKSGMAIIKKELVAYLQDLVDSQQASPLSWKCSNCDERHSGNLFKKVTRVAADFTIADKRADLAFFDADDKLFAVVHLIKRKTVDQSLNDFYKEKCICMQIIQGAGEDLESLRQKLQRPDFVTVCFNPKCKTCGDPTQKIKLWIVDSQCYKCNGSMKVAAVEAGMTRGANYAGPEDFTPQEIETARAKGVIIVEHYSKTREERYLANTCPHCGAFVGSFYLFQHHISPAGYGDYPYELIHAGYCCERCDTPDWV